MPQQKSRNQLTSSKECCKILSVSSFFPPPPVAHVRALCQRRDALEKRVEPERNLRRWEAQLLEAATNIQHPFGRFVVVFPEPQAHMENAPAQGFAKKCSDFICLGFTLTEYIRIKSALYLLCSLAEKNLGKNPRPHATHTHAGHDSLQSINMHPWSGVWGMVVWKLSAWAKASLLQSGPSGRADSGALVLKIITVRVG